MPLYRPLILFRFQITPPTSALDRSADLRRAPLRSAAERSALERSALSRIAPPNFAPLRFALLRLAILRFARPRFAPERFAFSKLTPPDPPNKPAAESSTRIVGLLWRHSFQFFTPVFKIASCSAFGLTAQCARSRFSLSAFQAFAILFSASCLLWNQKNFFTSSVLPDHVVIPDKVIPHIPLETRIPSERSEGPPRPDKESPVTGRG